MKKLFFAGAALLVLLGIGAAVMYFTGDQEYTGYETIKEWEGSDTASYTMADEKLIRYGQEGAQAVAADGTLWWNVTYNSMKKPLYDFCDDKMVVADSGSKEFVVSDGTGVARTYSTPFPIQEVRVAKQGVTAVLMNEDEYDYVYMYDINGTLLTEIETVVAKDGFPVTIALSEDGTKLVTSYMTIENDEPVGCVTFYNFGGVGQNYSRNLVGQIQYSKTLVPRIKFWGNDNVVVLCEDQIEFFEMKEIPSSVFHKEITTSIKSVAFGDYFCMITMSSDGQEILEAYDKSGKVCMMKVIGFPYVGLQTAGKNVVLYSNSACEIYTVGKEKYFKGTFENGIRGVFAVGGNRFFLVGNKKESVIKLTK